MDLSLIFNKEAILVDFEANSKNECLQSLAELLYQMGIVSSDKEFLQSVLAREEQSTTGVGQQIAIPHGKSQAVKKTSCIIVKVKDAIDWDSLDKKPVKLIFLLAIEEKDQNDTHLKILSTLAGQLIDEAFVSKLLDSTTKEEIYDALILNEQAEIEEQFI
ncbi:fructose PTS transporter subunit IIA [Neobacillus drentensis]|uniref:PTS sugar transporter subunit IIA n=1 Tax=Neobacillus drentensis TaxID=220684 RepID=UPI002FFF9D85